jgi:hypothetical protein
MNSDKVRVSVFLDCSLPQINDNYILTISARQDIISIIDNQRYDEELFFFLVNNNLVNNN